MTSIEFSTGLPLDLDIESPDKMVSVLLTAIQKCTSEELNRNEISEKRVNVKTTCSDTDVGMEIPVPYLKKIIDANRAIFKKFGIIDILDCSIEQNKDLSYDLILQH